MYVELEHRIRTAVRKRQADKEVEQRNRKLLKANKELGAAKQELSARLEEISAGNQAMAAAEEELRASESRYRSLFEGMVNGAAVHQLLCDENGNPFDYRFLEMNAAFEELTGMNRSETLGKTMREALKEVEPIWIERYGRVALTGVADHFESYSQALGRNHEVSVYRNAPMQFTVIITDVTVRKRAEDALRSSEEKFKAIANYAASWECWFDLDGRLLWMNSYSIALTGYAPEEYIAARDFVRMAIAEEDRTKALEKIQDAIAAGAGTTWRCGRFARTVPNSGHPSPGGRYWIRTGARSGSGPAPRTSRNARRPRRR